MNHLMDTEQVDHREEYYHSNIENEKQIFVRIFIGGS